MTVEDRVEVHLRGLSIAVYRRAQQHSDELFRELALVAAHVPEPGHDIPVRLMALVAAMAKRYRSINLDARRWVFGEIVGQLDGKSPRRWAER